MYSADGACDSDGHGGWAVVQGASKNLLLSSLSEVQCHTLDLNLLFSCFILYHNRIRGINLTLSVGSVRTELNMGGRKKPNKVRGCQTLVGG